MKGGKDIPIENDGRREEVFTPLCRRSTFVPDLGVFSLTMVFGWCAGTVHVRR